MSLSNEELKKLWEIANDLRKSMDEISAVQKEFSTDLNRASIRNERQIHRASSM